MPSQQAGKRDRVRDVASKYQASGYEVILEPGPADLPYFLGDYRPDFIAKLGNDFVLVEVKSKASPEVMDRYRELAERINAQPGWRLDLVVEGEPDEVSTSGFLPIMSTTDVQHRYDQAEMLLNDGHHEAALLMAWAATEATLRILAERNAIAYQRSATPKLLKQLVSLGVLERRQYQELWSSYQRRSAIAHGFADRGEPVGARAVIELGRAVLAEAQRAA